MGLKAYLVNRIFHNQTIFKISFHISVTEWHSSFQMAKLRIFEYIFFDNYMNIINKNYLIYTELPIGEENESQTEREKNRKGQKQECEISVTGNQPNSGKAMVFFPQFF